MSQPTLNSCFWSLAQLNERFVWLAEAWRRPLPPTPAPPAVGLATRPELERWIAQLADWYELEAEPFELTYYEAAGKIAPLQTGLLWLIHEPTPTFVWVEKATSQTVTLLAPDQKSYTFPLKALLHHLQEPLAAQLRPEVTQLLHNAQITGAAHEKAAQFLLQERLGGKLVARGWLMRLPAGAGFLDQLRFAQVDRVLGKLSFNYVVKMVFWLGSWGLLWQGVTAGQPQWGWLTLWALFSITSLIFRFLESWYLHLFILLMSWLFKRRLLGGGLKLEPEEIRHQGVGQLLGRVIEADITQNVAFEGLIFLGSHLVLDVLLILPILWAGGQGPGQIVALMGWLAFIAGLVWRYGRQRYTWTQQRLTMTHELVEKMVGHQTRLAQEEPQHRHTGEDEQLARYGQTSAEMDQQAAWLKAVAARGWLVVGLLTLAPAFIEGSLTPTSLALSLGGILTVFQALLITIPALLEIPDAFIAWESIKPLFTAATRPAVKGVPLPTAAPRSEDNLLEVRRLTYRYRPDGPAVLDNCHLLITPGERLLLEGASGGGKSTLATLLTGLRQPQTGLMLLNGLDFATLGQVGWRQKISFAPQFHENHLFIGTLAFNLLMGQSWPADEPALKKAQAICEELGLGELLAKMPSGLEQTVGQIGWQLSHGERSRVFIGRALLQNSELLILDESFGALDPETMRLALACVRRHSPTLVVIAHP